MPARHPLDPRPHHPTHPQPPPPIPNHPHPTPAALQSGTWLCAASASGTVHVWRLDAQRQSSATSAVSSLMPIISGERDFASVKVKSCGGRCQAAIRDSRSETPPPPPRPTPAPIASSAPALAPAPAPAPAPALHPHPHPRRVTPRHATSQTRRPARCRAPLALRMDGPRRLVLVPTQRAQGRRLRATGRAAPAACGLLRAHVMCVRGGEEGREKDEGARPRAGRAPQGRGDTLAEGRSAPLPAFLGSPDIHHVA